MAKTDPARDARLAAALRDNLRRRKAQNRQTTGRDGASDSGAPDQKKEDAQPASE